MNSDKFNFFSNSKPELLSDNALEQLKKLARISESRQAPVIKTLPVSDFYKNWLRPNLVPIIIVIMFTAFLLYRFMSTQNENLDTKVSNEIDKKIYNNNDELYDEYKKILNNKSKNNDIESILTDDMYDFAIKENKRSREKITSGVKNNWENAEEPLMNPFIASPNVIEPDFEATQFAVKQNKNILDKVAEELFK